ncbi:AMP-binding protein [Bacteriovoracales bacterium]|nr:AMP-binding protein [Bacteriovoracales bacterium]
MEKRWHGLYHEETPKEIDPLTHSSLLDILDESFSNYSQKDFLSSFDRGMTYQDVDLQSKKFSSFLQNDLGLNKGDRIALMIPNILQYPICLFGAIRAGLIVVNISLLYNARDLKRALIDSESKVIVALDSFSNIIEKCYEGTSLERILFTHLGDYLNFPKSFFTNLLHYKGKRTSAANNIPIALNLSDELEKADEGLYKRPETNLDDIVFLQYTGGTTGSAKAVELTHSNLLYCLMQNKAWFGPTLEEGKEINIVILPMHHIFSVMNFLFLTHMGALNILVAFPRSISELVKLLKKWKISTFFGVSSLFNAIAEDKRAKKVDFSSLKVSVAGGMPLEKGTFEIWKSLTGKPLLEVYSLTEATSFGAINPINTTEYGEGIGIPPSSTVIEIKNENGEEVPIGDIGEVSLKGPQVTKGYWQRQKGNFTEDGFFLTGDLGIMDEKGVVKIVDRKKDMILVSGLYVYPNEIEEVILAHPKVEEVAAIGVKDVKKGQVIKIFAVKNDFSLTEGELRLYCETHLTGYKTPKYIEFIKAIPKTNIGKILRKNLRNM